VTPGTLARQLLPPVALDALRRLARRKYSWSGVYPSFDAVPAAGRAFSAETYVRLSLDEARRVISTSNHCTVTPTEAVNEYAAICMLSALACRQNGGRLSVLDFGGGLGLGYVHLLSSLGRHSALVYHIVELEWACRAGSSLFPDDARVQFHASLPEGIDDLDVVLLKSVLYCIQDYAGLLKQLCDYRARYVLISELFAGSFPTFATAQRGFDGTVFPCWFFNVGEIVGLMRQHGYALACRGATEQVHNQGNFPADRRLESGRASQLLFSRLGPR